jgi:hypothetical protein
MTPSSSSRPLQLVGLAWADNTVDSPMDGLEEGPSYPALLKVVVQFQTWISSLPVMVESCTFTNVALTGSFQASAILVEGAGGTTFQNVTFTNSTLRAPYASLITLVGGSAFTQLRSVSFTGVVVAGAYAQALYASSAAGLSMYNVAFTDAMLLSGPSAYLLNMQLTVGVTVQSLAFRDCTIAQPGAYAASFFIYLMDSSASALQDLTFTGTSFTGTGAALYIYNSNNVAVECLTFSQATTSAARTWLVLVSGGSRNSVSQISCQGSSIAGRSSGVIFVTGSAGTTIGGVSVSGSTLASTGGALIYLSAATDITLGSTVMQGNVVSGTYAALLRLMSTAQVAIQGLTIAQATISGSSATAVLLVNTTGSTVMDQVTLTGLTLSGSLATAFYLSGANATLLQGLSITGVAAPGRNAMVFQVSTSQATTLSDSLVEGVQGLTQPILLSGSTATFEGTTIANSNAGAVATQNSFLILNNCTITGISWASSSTPPLHAAALMLYRSSYLVLWRMRFQGNSPADLSLNQNSTLAGCTSYDPVVLNGGALPAGFCQSPVPPSPGPTKTPPSPYLRKIRILWATTFTFAGLLLTALMYILRQRLARLWTDLREWQDRIRRDRIAGQQLEALLSIHGVHDPNALATVQAVVGSKAPELVIQYSELKLGGVIAEGGSGVVVKGTFGGAPIVAKTLR